jgi:hypothetical protein
LKENVQFFLDAVQEYGVPRHRLFAAADLLENRNKVNVVECLLTLAQFSTKKGFKPAFEPIAVRPNLHPPFPFFALLIF